MIETFTAMDFETANGKRNSACSLALTVIEKGVMIKSKDWLIKPVGDFARINTSIHGIKLENVKDAPTWLDLWPEIKQYFSGAMVAHNMSFDNSVLKRTCEHYDITPPDISKFCTLKIAKKTLELENHKLPTVCKYFSIDLLNHHDAKCDSEAAAEIFLEFQEMGIDNFLGVC